MGEPSFYERMINHLRATSNSAGRPPSGPKVFLCGDLNHGTNAYQHFPTLLLTTRPPLGVRKPPLLRLEFKSTVHFVKKEEENSMYYTGYPKDLGPSRVIDFTSERDFVHLLHEGYPVVAAFTIRCNLTRHLDKVLEEAASEFYPHVKFIRVECPKYPGFCISRQKTEYPFIEIFHTPEQSGLEGVAFPRMKNKFSTTSNAATTSPSSLRMASVSLRKWSMARNRSMGQVKTEEWNERDLYGSKLMGALLPFNTLSRGHLQFLLHNRTIVEFNTIRSDFLFENASERVRESEYKRLRAPSNQGRIVDTNITKYSVKVIPYNYDLSAYGFREFFKRHGIRSSDPK
ncbi:hypothetical protein F8388_010815 [Cannabis sativa]|uniref:Uncharacterized protein n=1 Tax=Cannabis sativa TaxID=3483 RepID=A0A7J6HC22_CANSA|nr:hypothetical protein G4B88_003871 [Cannabis sativa]KAF4392792.1 hypothetical protein F8388_010815 [Cannabis sativa]